jgi:hypothetical protein
MADYYPLISSAIAALDNKSEEARRAVYDRARAALENQFQKAVPPLSEANVEIQRLALEDAINRVEADSQGWVERKEAASSAEQMVRAHQARRDAQWANWIAVAAGIIAIAAVIIATISLIVALSSKAG